MKKCVRAAVQKKDCQFILLVKFLQASIGIQCYLPWLKK